VPRKFESKKLSDSKILICVPAFTAWSPVGVPNRVHDRLSINW